MKRISRFTKRGNGYFEAEINDILPGSRYFFRSDDGKDCPDPASHFQPEGVHGPSEVVDHTSFEWQDQSWKEIPFNELILYELHVGTFTKEGTFEAIIPILDEVADTAYTDGFVHSGEFVKFRKKKHGASSAGIQGDRFIVFNQNHDQIGNRVLGERLCHLADFGHLKLAAAALLLSPYVPLLFMGEEYADASPFFYFVSHSDRDLIEAVREGRKKEFENFNWKMDPPDPQDGDTFNRSKLHWNLRSTGKHKKKEVEYIGC